MSAFSSEDILKYGFENKLMIMDVEAERFFKYAFFNQKVLDETNLSTKDYGRRILDIYPDEHGLFIYLQFQKTVEKRDVHIYEDFYQTVKGEVKSTRTMLKPLFNEKNECVQIVVMIYEDTLTEQAEIEALTLWKKVNREAMRYEALFRHNLDAILLMTMDGYIRTGNKTVEDITGYTVGELNGVKLSDLIIDQSIDLEAVFRASIANKNENYPIDIRSKEKEKKRILLKVVPILIDEEIETVYCIFKDVTAIAKSAKALRAREEQLQLITDNMEDFVTLMNRDRDIVYASPSYKHFLGIEVDECRKEVFMENVFEEDRQFVEETLTAFFDQKKQDAIQYRQYNAEGDLVWCESKSRMIYDEDGKLVNFIVFTRDITLEKVHKDMLEYQVHHDYLTGLPNRKFFSEALEKALSEFNPNQAQLAIVMVDIDNFKEINDIYGHDIGDEVIKTFGQRLKSVIGEEDLIARLGGDEFVILLPQLAARAEVIEIAKKIHAMAKKPWPMLHGRAEITSSKGIAIAKAGMTSKQLIKQADIALYHTKEKGKNTYVLYE